MPQIQLTFMPFFFSFRIYLSGISVPLPLWHIGTFTSTFTLLSIVFSTTACLCMISFLKKFYHFQIQNPRSYRLHCIEYPLSSRSFQISLSVVSGLQQARPPCPSPTPGADSNSCQLRPSNHLIFCCPLLLSPSIFPSIRVFSNESVLNWTELALGGQSIGVSALASVLPMDIQDWFPIGWTGWISLQSKRLSRVFSNTTVQKHQFFGAQLSL